MCGTMNVQVEVWAVAADTRGIWLVNGGDAWLSVPIPQDSDPHFEVEIVLRRHALSADDVRMLHSTSWRADGPHVILTYIAVVDRSGIVVTHWPQALPLGDELLTVVGPPPTNPADAAPLPRYIDVLAHAVRHLRFLQDHDATASAAMPPTLAEHLTRLAPALAGLYSTKHTEHTEP